MYETNSPIKLTVSPWQQEDLRQNLIRRRQAGFPRCLCCGQIVVSERFLQLADFGLKGVGCERCVDKAMVWNDF